jgi:hypothetical protein
MKKIFCILFLQIIVFFVTKGQVVNTATIDTTDVALKGKLSVGGYIDTYFGYDHNQPIKNNHPYGVSSFRHNEFNVNLAFVDVKYASSRVRARFVPGFGTYMNANYAAEPATLRNIVEASIGVRLFKNKQIWLDAGVIGSPFTNESAISKDHLMYTRSLSAEYSPYYLTGVKLSFVLSNQLNFYTYVLNGWQNIQETNDGKAVATQLEYRPTSKLLLNWNTYVGSEKTDSTNTNRMRYFSDIYLIYNPEGKFSATACAYIGLQERILPNRNNENALWGQVNVIGRYKITPILALSSRLEYFHDKDAVMIMSVVPTTPNGFRGGSASLCFNIQLLDNLLFRIEHRSFFTQDKMYLKGNGEAVNSCQWTVANMTAWF